MFSKLGEKSSGPRVPLVQHQHSPVRVWQIRPEGWSVASSFASVHWTVWVRWKGPRSFLWCCSVTSISRWGDLGVITSNTYRRHSNVFIGSIASIRDNDGATKMNKFFRIRSIVTIDDEWISSWQTERKKRDTSIYVQAQERGFWCEFPKQ